MAEPLCHVVTAAALAQAGDRLVGEPFLHCCTEAQLAFVLARHFAGRIGLVVLRFDPAQVESRIEWVRSEPDQDPFPHLYGPLMLSLVTAEPLP
ncbi:MAG: DUF952 domain-containing protein [Acetobacteraceae bacterium]